MKIQSLPGASLRGAAQSQRLQQRRGNPDSETRDLKPGIRINQINFSGFRLLIPDFCTWIASLRDASLAMTRAKSFCLSNKIRPGERFSDNWLSSCHIAFALMIFMVALPDFAFAQQEAASTPVGQIIRNVAESLKPLTKFLPYVSYILGFVILIRALFLMRQKMDKPESVTVFMIIMHFVAAGLFISLPYTATVLLKTLGLAEYAPLVKEGVSAPTIEANVVTMATRLIQAIYDPLKKIIPFVCFVMGIGYLMVGINRLTKNPTDGPRGPAGIGTLMTFVIAGVFMSIGSAFNKFVITIFGGDAGATHTVLKYPGSGAGQALAQVQATVPAILMFVSVVGWISFIRGWLLLRSVAEGDKGASLAGGLSHIIGGVLCANITQVIQAVQTTLGMPPII